VAELPSGTRITDYISLGVITKSFPLDAIRADLDSAGRTSIRQRDLPAHVVVYYVIALALYMQSSYREVLRCLLEGIKWLLGPGATLKTAGKSGISQARTRLGWEPLQKLHDEVVKPIAVESTKGAWYRSWRLVSLDGSTLDVADQKENERAFEARKERERLTEERINKVTGYAVTFSVCSSRQCISPVPGASLPKSVRAPLWGAAAEATGDRIGSFATETS
ncbi:MAG: hypothetical protein FJW35_15015, partial [Acidobacteria bacterium]|nr:hypothetical protein [Acidobacteriota bacterium]